LIISLRLWYYHISTFIPLQHLIAPEGCASSRRKCVCTGICGTRYRIFLDISKEGGVVSSLTEALVGVAQLGVFLLVALRIADGDRSFQMQEAGVAKDLVVAEINKRAIATFGPLAISLIAGAILVLDAARRL